MVEHLPGRRSPRRCGSPRRSSARAACSIAETINPLSPIALRNYFADLTHAQPLVPETLELLARQAGFAETEIRFLNEPAERLTEPDDPVIAANVRRLNELLFAPLDYALVAQNGQRMHRHAHVAPVTRTCDKSRRRVLVGGRGGTRQHARVPLRGRIVRIAVCAPQVPFARGGAEIFADDLVGELRERGHETDLVTIPYKWYPGERVLSQAFLWRLLDLERSRTDARSTCVIATKFPSYAVRHPNKIVWLLHQFRQAYELDRTELGQFGGSAEDRATRRAVQRAGRRRPRRGAEGVRNVAERGRPASSARRGSTPR